MPVAYTKTDGQGHVYQVPDYPEAADGPKAFKDFANFLDLILPPVGTIMPYVGTTAPTGWLPCNGGEYSSTTYPKLSALCGEKFGTAATAGNFKVPDLRGRVIAGLDSSQTEFATVGKADGAKTVTLTVSNMPSHNHTAELSGLTVGGLAASSAPDHTHGAGTFTVGGAGGHGHWTKINEGQVVVNVTSNDNVNTAGTGGLTRVSSLNVTKNSASDVVSGYSFTPFGGTDGSHSHTFSGTSASAGGHTHTISGTVSGGTVTVANRGDGSAVNNLQPYLTLNHIIRAA